MTLGLTEFFCTNQSPRHEGTNRLSPADLVAAALAKQGHPKETKPEENACEVEPLEGPTQMQHVSHYLGRQAVLFRKLGRCLKRHKISR